MAREHFQNGDFWEDMPRTRIDTLRRIARTGFDGKAYFRFPRELAKNLKRAAEIITERYDGDARKIWNVDAEHVDKIYDRLREFRGIGDALAKMGQFALVRDVAAVEGLAADRLGGSGGGSGPMTLTRRTMGRRSHRRGPGFRNPRGCTRFC